jgi:hypothetical protein
VYESVPQKDCVHRRGGSKLIIIGKAGSQAR